MTPTTREPILRTWIVLLPDEPLEVREERVEHALELVAADNDEATNDV